MKRPMKLTKRQAIEACGKLWKELSVSGDSSKPESANSFLFECPLCEWSTQEAKVNRDVQEELGMTRDVCKHCPGLDLWLPTEWDKEHCELTGGIPCHALSSPYYRWHRIPYGLSFPMHSIVHRRKMAGIIAKYFKSQ